jgi:hypothetical protein
MLFVGSEDAQMMSGEILVLDGGQSITSNRFDDYSANLKKAAQ